MGKRSRLFASAAFPLLSLSIAFEPAAAAALREQVIAPLSSAVAGSVAVDGGASFEVAQEQPQGGESEEELRKHKKPGEAEQGQKHEAAPEPEQPKPHKQQEAPQPKAVEKPAAPEAQPPEPPAPKKPHAQNAEQPGAQPEVQPRPKAAAPAAVAPETQQGQPEQKKHKQNADQQPAAQPEIAPQPKQAAPAEAPQGEPAQKPHQKPQAEPAEPAQQKAPAQQEAPAAHQQNQKPPAQSAEPTQQKAPTQQGQQAKPEGQAQPEQKSQPKPQGQTAAPAQQEAPAVQPSQAQQGTAAQPETPVAPGSQQGQKPGGNKAQGKPQQGEQPPAANPQQPALKAEPQQNQAAPQPGKPQPSTEAGAPAQGNAKQPAANGAPQQQGAETAVPPSAPVSPEELERRKKIAENPAESKGPVILPVQNGAAVLDSDKDAARRGHRQGGQNPGGQPGTQAGQPGQAVPAQGGQGQARQGQAAQGQPAQGQTTPVPPPAAYAKPPTSDAEAQRAAAGGQPQPPVKMEAVTSEQGRRLDRRPNFAAPAGAAVQTIINQDNRTIVNVDNNYVVRNDDTDRFVRAGERPTYEQLARDRYRETIDQPDGDRIITVRNRYGDIIQRSRVDADGREYVLFYSPELEQRPDDDDYFRDPGDDLPPMRLSIPVSQYIIDTGTDRDADYYDFLREPPVEPVERIYSVNEVRYSARIRDKVRRIDLDTITFATGSAEIPMSQASTLRNVADAMGKIIKRDPTESFLIEGHTDAVGSPESNLILSDQRAESVAKVLSDVYGIPAENLVTQGYGEQYLKVNTQGPEQENRRVTIRRITALVRPVVSNR
ncbi:OmpA family protein [Rhizobium sp. BK602]|uniref:OmpA family protein n=1 Tax=Rhizobium sp. BK602 TaxID=2586986 RepID=UPI00161949D9|nr:OmpA family protein [Rhizobium sp. BK602]MBB3607663.1 outer membrane protein OmpA-like peptidoglycan-associated protein [Rhizobium sp. BK602]